MPSSSRSQYKFFKWLEANPEEASKRKISKQNIKDFTKMSSKRFKKLKDRINKK